LEFVSLEAGKYYKRLNVAMYMMNELAESELNELIVECSELKVQEIDKEVSLILTANKDLTTEQKGELNKIEYMIKKVNEEVLETIIKKTEGNVIASLEFVLSLLKSNYLTNKGGTLLPSENFIKAKELNDWKYIDIPNTALNVNIVILDKLTSV